jgi:hypothetical protein
MQVEGMKFCWEGEYRLAIVQTTQNTAPQQYRLTNMLGRCPTSELRDQWQKAVARLCLQEIRKYREWPSAAPITKNHPM